MQFEVWAEGPPQVCGDKCRTWVSASGAITSDTPRDFEAFAKSSKLDGMTIALDSDGGSVLGALALGRSIRKLGMTTTVGSTVDLANVENGRKRAKLQPRAYCKSMCAFVLLAGVERQVPAEARVMVHQIWLGDRRDDPTAANYSAEDLVVVQRDIGRLAQYTVEMGGGIDLLEIALKIPPWEPMRLLSRDELRGMKIVTAGEATRGHESPARRRDLGGAGQRRARCRQRPRLGDAGQCERRPHGARPQPSVDRRGRRPRRVRSELQLRRAGARLCRDLYRAAARRRGRQAAGGAQRVEITMLGRSVPLKVVSSRTPDKAGELTSVATGRISVECCRALPSATAVR